MWAGTKHGAKLKPHNPILAVLLICCLIFPFTNVYAQTDQPGVRAVLFYSPTCGHCEHVINGTLIPMLEQYGDRLQIIALDVTQQQGQVFFHAAMQKFNLEQAGVPFLVIDDMYLIGSVDIPEKFPGLVDSHLAQGGLDWPEIPGLIEVLEVSQSAPQPTSTPAPVVRAVLFHRSACSHCKKVTEEVVPPLVERYGTQLEIFGVDASSPDGEIIFRNAIERYDIQRIGVPTLILGDQVLVGGVEIEEKFPSIIEGYLMQGGKDWPDIPGLQEAISKASAAASQSASDQAGPVPASTSSTDVPANATPGILGMDAEPAGWLDRFGLDPAGNTLSVIVLVGMLGSVAWVFSFFRNGNGVPRRQNWDWVIPLLCAIGIGVAGYLAYVETTETAAVCGPVGDCNTVQQSEYARLFGILPIGVLGLIGYAGILMAWLVARSARKHIADIAVISLFGMTAFGTLFSIYLTFLEPFVIGATCAWCLTSAILMTVLMLLSTKPTKAALLRKKYVRQRFYT